MHTTNRKTFADTFYSRQIAMKELGINGQRRLSEAKVAIVGIGGLGTVSSLYLALAGVGHLRLIDQDTVETQNLHRQILYTAEDTNYPKAEIAAQRLTKLNPLIKAEPASENLNAANAEQLLADADCVVDGLDNMLTRYLINRTCAKLGIPYVFGAAIGIEGNLSVFNPPKTPCLECVLPNLPDNELMKCNTRGVLGATPGIIGAMQAMETVKLLTNIGKPLKNKLMVCDFSDMTFTTIDIAKRSGCPTCQGTAALPKPSEKLVWLCGRNTANVNPEKPLNLNLAEIHATVKQNFAVRLKSHLAVIFEYDGLEVSLFNGGRMLIKNVQSEQEALKAYREILEKLKVS
ncbi:MAG: HesA/MoeB/ThiF family protein [Candidatus Bathyarchaeota archaeon]|nr:HesA/MoeB/ThiF family protein [Candidatus Bathyarchaeota archaeon]